MPCEDCGHLLIRKEDSKSLFCPRCRGLPVESQKVVDAKVNWLTKDFFTDEAIISVLQDYSKVNLIYNLFNRLNQMSYGFYNELEQGIPVSEFGYLAYVLNQIYGLEDFGVELVEERPESTEKIESVIDAYSELIFRLQHARNQFTVCIRKDEFTNRFENFASDYNRFQSEYGLCFRRCLNSVICNDMDAFDDFSYVADVLRAVDKTEAGEEQTSREFGDAWYQVIEQLRFMAGSDDMVGPTYYTKLPEDVTIFDLKEFLDRLDSLFSEEPARKLREEAWVAPLRKQWVESCGRKAFGDDWDQVRDRIILSEDNLDAHPLLFELEFRVKRDLPGSRRPSYVPKKQIYYPRYFSQLLQFQIFPLLRNGDVAESGHQILSELAGDRGTERERNLYDFLTDRGIECYHGAETQKNKNEVDLVCVRDSSLQIIEVKYLMPPIRINDPDGIRELNEKFDRLIFNEESENTSREPEGKPFPEKAEGWKGLEPGEEFRSQVSDHGEYQQQEVPESWNDLDVEMLVVSNVVPSYIEKQGVRFITDLELYQMVEHGEDVFYDIP
ncbi:hypothetical protein [Haloarcula marina]|uniref:hypothetical protein n=1 Tax=Haloarcula marina TaxID=2961574 RepID=UPI0020B66AF2|nr:hypothetical protein [Halomicroarcula marina]